MKLSEHVATNIPKVTESSDWEAMADLLDEANAIPSPAPACRLLEAAMLLAEDAAKTAGAVEGMPYGIGFLYLYRFHGESFAIKLDVNFDGGYHRVRGYGLREDAWERVANSHESMEEPYDASMSALEVSMALIRDIGDEAVALELVKKEIDDAKMGPRALA